MQRPRHARRSGGADGRQSWVARPAVIGSLWLTALGLTGLLAYLDYGPAARGVAGVDFDYFFRAAQNLSAGQSPYSNLHQYVYPPTIALILEPFIHIRPHEVWQVWVAVIVAAPVVGVAAFVASRAARLPAWLYPVLFAFCSSTLLFGHFWPMRRELYLGQIDTMTFPFVLLSVLFATRGASALRGVALGAAAVLKGWPGAIGISVFQRGVRGRWRTLLALVATALIAPLMALAVAGWSGLTGFVKNAFDAREQASLINDSVWAVPQLLFSRSGLAHPVEVSMLLRYGVSALLACWIIGLAVVVLRTRGDPALCTFNVIFCMLMLLPVAHRQYAIFVLPLLWFWVADLIGPGPVDPRRVAVLAVIAGWWVVQCFSWPYTYSSPTISAARYSVPFIADLLACTASVLGGVLLARAERRATPVPAPAPARAGGGGGGTPLIRLQSSIAW
jgi:hypothetical protein